MLVGPIGKKWYGSRSNVTAVTAWKLSCLIPVGTTRTIITQPPLLSVTPASLYP